MRFEKYAGGIDGPARAGAARRDFSTWIYGVSVGCALQETCCQQLAQHGGPMRARHNPGHQKTPSGTLETTSVSCPFLERSNIISIRAGLALRTAWQCVELLARHRR